MKRDYRAALAQQTLQILDDGFYSLPDGRRVDLAEALKVTLAGTRLFDASSLPAAPPPKYDGNAAIEVTAESTFEAIQRLAQDSAHVACLNFASAKNPGGGFLNGAQAQEEALARASTLYPSLLAQWHYYESNRAHESCLYLDQLIVSPEVHFFRDDSGTLLELPLSATVVTAPAPNAGAVHSNEPLHVAEIEPRLKQRAELVVRAMALAQAEALVLGAWGCGVFRNDPYTVAGAFAELIGSGGRYSRHFKKVVFAIYDPSGLGPNLTAFREVFRP